MDRTTPPLKLFFVGGAPKSGTTWVQLALDQHPEILCSGEGHIHERIIAPMWLMLNQYNSKLDEVGRLVYEGAPYIKLYPNDEIINEIRMFAERVLRRRRKEGAWIIGDKTPKYYETLRDLDLIFPGSKFVMTFRDPRDVAASRIAQAYRLDTKGVLHNLPHIEASLVRNSVSDWLRCLRKCNTFVEDNSDSLIMIRYEDMLEDLSSVLTRVSRFLGAATNGSQISQIVEATTFRRLSGRDAGVEDKTSFFRKGISGDWPTHISRQSADWILERCGSGMRQIGYDV